MRISNYGVELQSMVESDLEMVRNWRNRSDVSEFMFFQEEITPEQQHEWFESLSNKDVYLMILHQSEKIGVINVKNINWWKRSGEAGIFIGDPTFRNTPISMQAIFTMMDAFFYDFRFKSLTATVKSNNENAIDFNQQLGYKVMSEIDDKINMEVFRSPYTEARTKFTIILEKFCQSAPEMELSKNEKRMFQQPFWSLSNF
ncbi:MAG: GNAT family N-acetyltransferase [Flavobacteriales bacterium]|nr:GNAT family N-acetyltransferase [Flavobacteriales bacterium]